MVLSFWKNGVSIADPTPGDRPVAFVESVRLSYRGKEVNGKKLTVHSVIPMPVDQVWQRVQTPALLQFVARGMLTFRALKGTFPDQWQLGVTYRLRMRVFGVIPFGGIHHLYVARIDAPNHQITTQEWDKRAKVWNHEINLLDFGDDQTQYTDIITIYGGWQTGLITAFAKKLYKHRQKRWQIVARKGWPLASQ